MSFSACLPGASRPRHCVAMKIALPSLPPNLPSAIEPLGADDLAVLEGDRRLLEAVGAHGAQPLVGDELAAAGMLVVAVHEGVFLGLPVIALELVGDVVLAGGAPGPLQRLGQTARRSGNRASIGRGGPCSARSAACAARHSSTSGSSRPTVAAGSTTCAAWPILVGTMSTSTLKRPPWRIAPMMASTCAFAVAIGDAGHGVLHHVGALLVASS